jgi:hypothetical protein
MPQVAVLVTGLLALAATTHSQPRVQDRWLTGHYYRLGTSRGELLGRWEMSLADSVWTSQYVSVNDSLAVEDTLRWNGARIATYAYVRYVSGERSRVVRRGERLEYTVELAGKRSTAQRSADSLFLVGPVVVPFVQEHWEELVGGKTLRFHYGVLDQRRAFRFEVAVDPKHPVNSEDAVVFRMKASSFIVRRFVSPIYLVYGRREQEIRAIVGRSLVLERRDGDIRPVDAEIVIEERLPRADGSP